MDNRRSISPDVIGSAAQPDTGGVSSADRTVDLDDIDEKWTSYFPFDEPYTDQVEGINEFLAALNDHEYMVMEGACGTGKTLIGLVAGIHAARTTRQYRRVLIATPVKQQLKQFIEEMRTINEQLVDEPVVDTVVARGKQDMSPYANISIPPFDSSSKSLHDVLQDMREDTTELIDFGSEIPLDWPEEMDPPPYSEYDGDWDDAERNGDEDLREKYRFDPFRAQAVVNAWANQTGDRFTVKGYESPYPDEIPVYDDVVRTSAVDSGGWLDSKLDTTHFDPFYAGYFSYEHLPFGFSDAAHNVLDGDTLLKLSVEHGVLPHEALAKLMGTATVVIGNYYHVFDTERTRLLTDEKAGIIDEETITILDEAHNLEPFVRDMLSKTMGAQGLRWAQADLEAVLGYVKNDTRRLPPTEPQNDDNIAAVRKSLGHRLHENDIKTQDIGRAITFLNSIESFLFERSETFINTEFDSGVSSVLSASWEDLSKKYVPLEDPEDNGADELVDEIEAENIMDWVEFRRIATYVNKALNEINGVEREPRVEAVGDFFYSWYSASGSDYFRELKLTPTASDKRLDTDYDWSRNYVPSFSLYNTIPTKHIRGVLSELGGGLLMSATLEPMNNYIKTTGVDRCIHPCSVDEKDDRRAYVQSEKDTGDPDITYRDVRTTQFPLRFPAENRDSFIVTAQRYTSKNRGYRARDTGSMTRTRQTYANIITDIATSHGNVLIAFPSYSEASWAHDILADRISKPVLVDESTPAEETDELLENFTDDRHAVILTSTRGTITEGVDYAGNLLHVAAVIGISLTPPTPRHKAVQYAYDEKISGVDGWEAADLIPATRKARQAIGRVIRGTDELGVRILVDERYAQTGWSGVNDYLSDQEQHEFTPISPTNVKQRLHGFWDTRLD